MALIPFNMYNIERLNVRRIDVAVLMRNMFVVISPIEFCFKYLLARDWQRVIIVQNTDQS